MDERIYRMPRTYGSPTGYDIEVSSYPNTVARFSEKIAYEMARSEAYRNLSPQEFAVEVCDRASAMVSLWEKRGWLLPVEDAPAMDKDYGAKRGESSGTADAITVKKEG